jgi:hypothetical protein
MNAQRWAGEAPLGYVVTSRSSDWSLLRAPNPADRRRVYYVGVCSYTRAHALPHRPVTRHGWCMATSTAPGKSTERE